MPNHQTTIDRFYQRTFATPQEAATLCETCGALLPVQETSLLGHTRYTHDVCQCVKDRLEAKRREEEWQRWLQANIGYTYAWLGSRWDRSSLAKKTFATFNPAYQPTAFEVVRAFAVHMQGTLILYGAYGTGKTHLLAALCNELRENRKESRFTTASHLFSAIQTAINYHEDYGVILEKAIKTPLLVLDDIDKTKHSDFREEIYFEIVDARVLHERPIAISTNRLDELANFVGGAVCSRFKVGQIALQLQGKDYREEI